MDKNNIIHPDVLKSHAITEEALLALRNDDQVRFLRLRHAELIRLEREFMNIHGVNINLLDLKRNPFQSMNTAQLDLFGSD